MQTRKYIRYFTDGYETFTSPESISRCGNMSH